MKRVRAKKNLGQHFLTDMNIARRIADTVDLCPGLPILEVGAGTGMLTRFLAAKGRELKAVEIDREAVAFLRERFPGMSENIIGGDFLKMDLTLLFDGRPFVLTGNYPYDISSQIFFRVLDNKDLIPCCTGMIQRETALRIASPPGGRTYGIMSALLQTWYDIDMLMTVDEQVFSPPPKVKSAVISMRRNRRLRVGCDWAMMRRVIKTAFGQRRKMLRVSLKPLLTEEKMAALPSDVLPLLTERPEDLSPDQFILLTKALGDERSS